MLSAVAARKAAIAAALPSARSSPPSSPLKTPKSNKPTSNRKTHFTGPSRRKKVKITHVPTKQNRYFDLPDAQDANKLPSSIEVSSDSEESESEKEIEIGMEMETDAPLPASLSATKSQRAWSPSQPVVDSSDNDTPDSSSSFHPTSNLVPEPRTPEPLPLSTFQPALNQNVFRATENGTSGKAVILVLRPDETVTLVGTYSLCVLLGSLTLLGVTLSPSDTRHPVFAPRSSPLPVLSWASTDRRGSCTFPIPLAVRQQENITAILIEYVHTGVEGLGRICRVFENAFKPPPDSCPLPGFDLAKLHVVKTASRDIHPFIIPSSWESALESVDERPGSDTSTPPVCLVKGPKKQGKSTLARTLVNRLLCRYHRVAFLECDLGQSEFTPGGMVALNIVENFIFGPPYTHPSLPYRAHFIGSTSPRSSPSLYLHSIQSLLESYKLDLQFSGSFDEPIPGDERICDAIPLVVNTMGWIKGLGADLNIRIEELIQASHIFDIEGIKESGWLVPLQSQHVPRFPIPQSFDHGDSRQSLKVEAIQTETTNAYYTATDHRHLNILSYFHALFPEQPASSSSALTIRQITASSWDTSLPLCARYPYEVDCTKAFDRVYLTGSGYEDVVPAELTRVLNGAIIGLASSDSTDNHSQPINVTSQVLTYIPGELLPDPSLSTCHGLALIRGIPLSLNCQSPHMHILTPLPTALLTRSRLLVKGEMELPIWGMLDFRESEEGGVAGVEKGQVPYLQWGKTEGVGSEKRRVRRNLMRKAQM